MIKILKNILNLIYDFIFIIVIPKLTNKIIWQVNERKCINIKMIDEFSIACTKN